MLGLAQRLARESAARGTGFTASAVHRSLLLQASSYGRKISAREQSYTTESNGVASIEDVASIIFRENSSVLVMTGAGISTASGIPDFRSPGTGLYSNLQKYNLPYPEAIFDINYFANDPQPFFALARELYPGERYRPNAAHHFLRLLQDKGKLRRAYTQNIDGLERLSGVSGELLIEAHGSFSTASCIICKKEHDTEAVKRAILDHLPPVHCAAPNCSGLVKPDIVFFGEMLPQSFWQFEQDLQSLDLLLIMGTSLEVFPFASIAESAEYDTARVLLNNAPAGSIGSRDRDLWLKGDIVDTVQQLGGACGWGDELINIIRQDTE